MAEGVAPACHVVERARVADEDWLAVMFRSETAVGFWEMRETEIWVAVEETLPVAEDAPLEGAALEEEVEET